MKATFILFFSALLTSGTASAQLLWSDEFNRGTALDEAIWSYDLGASGWGNRELQEYTRDAANVAIEDGNLRISVLRQGQGAPFTSARVRTQDKLTFQYGTIEARIKVPDLADGLWPAFWTLGNNFSRVGWPHCGELDIMEMGSADAITRGLVNRRVGSTAHWENNGSHANYGLSLDANMDLSEDYHLFRMEWTPDAVTTFLDGERIWEIDIRPSSCTDCSEFHQPHFMILNVAVGGTYTGRFNAPAITATTPAEMLVDYVRIYDNGFTMLGGSGLDSTPTPLGAGHSGSWYNPDQSGHGFSMEFGALPDGSPFAVIYWYTYDNAGNPVFFVGTGVPEGNRVELEFVSSSGMIFGEFDPDTVVREVAGTATLEFADPDHATFSYVPSENSAQALGHFEISDMALERLFAIPVSGSTDTPPARQR